MRTNQNLKEIIERKNFKSFWHCYEFLIVANYSSIEAFSHSAEHFGIDKMFDDVAFIRFFYVTIRNQDSQLVTTKIKLIVGVIDVTNRHLTELYKVYNKSYNEGEVGVLPDIEGTCEVLSITHITPFIKRFIFDKMDKVFNIDTEKRHIQEREAHKKPASIGELERRFEDLRESNNRLQDLLRPMQEQFPYTPPMGPREDNIRFLNSMLNNNEEDGSNRA